MNKSPQHAYIITNTLILAQSIIQSMEDMAGISFELNKSSFKETSFSSPFNMTACIHFTGSVQGDYILALNEITASRLIEAYEDGMSEDDLREMREDFGGFIRELLNIAVGQSISELEQSFGNLTYNPATIIYGEIEFPDIMSGNVMIESNIGEIQCGFSLNLARLKIGQKLEEALWELEEKTIEANMAHKEVKTIMQLIPSAMLAVNADARVLPGHSRTAASILGYQPDENIIGMKLSELLKLGPEDSRVVNKFFQIFKEKDSFPFEEIQLMCEGRFSSQTGRIFKLDWLPVVNHKSHSLEKIMFIIEDITDKLKCNKL